MRSKMRVFAAAAVALGWSVAWAYDGGTVSDGGGIRGQVKYQGTAPAAKTIEITKDKEVCGATPKRDESLLVGGNGGIENVVVFIKNISRGKPMPNATPTLDQKGCRYDPHVLLIPAGATIDIRNDDGVLHNIHTYGKANPPTNMAQPKFRRVIHQRFEQPEIFEVRCDAHGWMQGWFVVQDNPYYAVTDENGNFELTDVPPGDYELEAWQETLGTKTQKITVPAKTEVTANFEFAGK